MRKRKSVLGETQQGQEEVNDAVLEGKVADIVYKQALEAIPGLIYICLFFVGFFSCCSGSVSKMLNCLG